MVAQRLVALQDVAVRGAKWEDAQYMELITPDSRGNLATPADYMTVMTERKAAIKIMPDLDSNSYWKGRGRDISVHGRRL